MPSISRVRGDGGWVQTGNMSRGWGRGAVGGKSGWGEMKSEVQKWPLEDGTWEKKKSENKKGIKGRGKKWRERNEGERKEKKKGER